MGRLKLTYLTLCADFFRLNSKCIAQMQAPTAGTSFPT